MTSRAPRKYADRARTIVRPEWTQWEIARKAEAEDIAWYTATRMGYAADTYFPGEKAIPTKGAWILVIEVPHTALGWDVPLLSMWRARHHEMNNGAIEITKGLKVYPQQAVIATPAGDLHLWPHEYIIATDPLGLVGDPDATLHQLGGSPVLDEEQMFYLMSRGISHHEATMLLFDQITNQDFVYVTFPDDVVAALAGVGQPLLRHMALNPR